MHVRIVNSAMDHVAFKQILSRVIIRHMMAALPSLQHVTTPFLTILVHQHIDYCSGRIGMRGVTVSHNYLGIKVTVLYTAGLFNTSMYRLEVLTTLKTLSNMAYFLASCILLCK